MFWNISRIYFFLFQYTKHWEQYLEYFPQFFSNFFFWWKMRSFPFIFIYKKFNFCYSLQIVFVISSWWNLTVKAYWKHLWSFLYMKFIAFLFLSNQENLYMIHHGSNLFYDFYNTINQHNQRQTHYSSSIFLHFFDILFWKDLKRFFIGTSYL